MDARGCEAAASFLRRSGAFQQENRHDAPPSRSHSEDTNPSSQRWRPQPARTKVRG